VFYYAIRPIIIGTYINDLLVFVKILDVTIEFFKKLKKLIKLKDLGKINYYLGIKVVEKDNALYLT
jgi:hypothetical protein